MSSDFLVDLVASVIGTVVGNGITLATIPDSAETPKPAIIKQLTPKEQFNNLSVDEQNRILLLSKPLEIHHD